MQHLYRVFDRLSKNADASYVLPVHVTIADVNARDEFPAATTLVGVDAAVARKREWRVETTVRKKRKKRKRKRKKKY